MRLLAAPAKIAFAALSITSWNISALNLAAEGQTSNLRPVVALRDALHGAVTLNAAQRSWIKRVSCNAYWKQRARHLWVAPMIVPDHSPIAVFYAPDWTMRSASGIELREPSAGPGYYIVGEGCGSTFNRISTVAAISPLPPGTSGGPCYADPFAKANHDETKIAPAD